MAPASAAVASNTPVIITNVNGSCGWNTEKQRRQAAGKNQCADEPEGGADDDEPEGAADDHAEYVATVGAERHSHADFRRPLHDDVGRHAVDADGGEDQRQSGKNGDERGHEARFGDGIRDECVERVDA